jgi:hypothetical protein
MGICPSVTSRVRILCLRMSRETLRFGSLSEWLDLIDQSSKIPATRPPRPKRCHRCALPRYVLSTQRSATASSPHSSSSPFSAQSSPSLRPLCSPVLPLSIGSPGWSLRTDGLGMDWRRIGGDGGGFGRMLFGRGRWRGMMGGMDEVMGGLCGVNCVVCL